MSSKKKAAKKTTKKAVTKKAKPIKITKTKVDDILDSTIQRDVTPMPVNPPITDIPPASFIEVPDDDEIGSEFAPKDLGNVVVSQGSESEGIGLRASDAADAGVAEADLSYVDESSAPPMSEQEPAESPEDAPGSPTAEIEGEDPQQPVEPAPEPPTTEPAVEAKDDREKVEVAISDLKALYSTILACNKIIDWVLIKVPARLMGGANKTIIKNRSQANLTALRSIRHLVK